VTQSDFDLKALYGVLDEQRRSRGITWAAVAREINHSRTSGPTIATSTISGLKSGTLSEGDGVLQMLRWLDRNSRAFHAL
jgi:hypothetical protein